MDQLHPEVLDAEGIRSQLRMLTEAALDAVVSADGTGTILEWNPKAEEVFGWTRDEAIGNNVVDLIVVPKYRDSHLRWMERFDGRVDDVVLNDRLELVGLRKDGTEVSVEATIWTNPSPEGSRFTAMIRDLTGKEREVEDRSRLFAVIDSSEDAIVACDLRGTILDWNPGAEALYGYTAEEALGSHVSMVFLPDRPDDLPDIIRRLDKWGSIKSLDGKRLTKTGEIVDVSTSVSLIRNRHGQPIGTSSIDRDITDRKRAEEELERRVAERTAELAEANRKLESLVASKTEFVASVSHELRTPLTSVIGFAELLRDSASEIDPDQRFDLLDEIADQGYELANIVEDLLVAARAEIGDLNVSCVSVNLAAQTAQVLESMRAKESSNIQVLGSSPPALADPQRVRQILRNLITNAVRYGGPNVVIEIGHDTERATVSVSDDGEGIAEDARATIFEPYTRAHHRPGVTESLGLGLAISRELARLMGGDLNYHQNNHCEFTISLPLGG